MTRALWQNFLGASPRWYKAAVLACLVINPLVLSSIGPFAAGWLLVAEFIGALAMALKCYPLQPGGLLVLQAVFIGLASADSVLHQVASNLPVILLLIFMVAGVHFMRDLLLFTFTGILLRLRSKLLLSLAFCAAGAFLSAFLDALTVVAVVIAVAIGFYDVYHRAASLGGSSDEHDERDDTGDSAALRDDGAALHNDLESFRSFLRSLLMHASVGTALGGVTTMVGEPQNLLIAHKVGWNFTTFFLDMAPVTLPVLVAGLFTCALVEHFGWFGYGAQLPARVRVMLQTYQDTARGERDARAQMRLLVQACSAILLIVALAMHWAEVGLLGLMIIVLQTAFNGITEEARLGPAFQDALPFTALLVVFFGVVAVIHDQQLFGPLIHYVLQLPSARQPSMFYIANGVLSAVSDNVFVASVYINEVKAAFDAGAIDHAQLVKLAIAINTGTNIPSVATPNGQAAFLFLLTSAVAPLIRLSYARMVVMALPYTITMSVTGYLCVRAFI